MVNTQSTVHGIGGALIIAIEGIKTIQRSQLAADLINLRSVNNNFEKAIFLSNFAVENGFIPAEFLKSAGPGSQPIDGNMGLKTDLVNYLMDGTLPSSDNPVYNEMIKKEGAYIWNNRDKIGVTMFKKGIIEELVPGEIKENYLEPATHYDNLSPSNFVAPLPVFKITIEGIGE